MKLQRPLPTLCSGTRLNRGPAAPAWRSTPGWFALALLVTAGQSGCSICQGPFDFDYPVFDSRHARVDPVYGRVGSIFSDPDIDSAGSEPLSNADRPRQENELDPVPVPDDPEFRQPGDDPFEGVDPDDLEIPERNQDTQARSWLGGVRYH